MFWPHRRRFSLLSSELPAVWQTLRSAPSFVAVRVVVVDDVVLSN